MMTDAKKSARKAPPMRVAFTFAGAAFETSASVIGQYHMKPKPMPNHPRSGHRTDTLSLDAVRAPTARRSPERPVIAAPIAIFVIALGSLFRRACHAQSATRNGATATLAKLSTELNQLAGTAPRRETRSTCWSTQTTPMFQIIV